MQQNVSIALNLAYYKNKLQNTLDYWSRDIFNFDSFEKSLGINSLPHFAYHFSRKMFLILYSLNWTNLIAWLLWLLEILDNMKISENSIDLYKISTNSSISENTHPKVKDGSKKPVLLSSYIWLRVWFLVWLLLAINHLIGSNQSLT